MKYSIEDNCINVFCDELIVTALDTSTANDHQQYSVFAADTHTRSEHGCAGEEISFSYTAECDDYKLKITASADKIEQTPDAEELTFLFLCDADTHSLPPRVKKHMRARAFCAAYIYGEANKRDRLSLRIICCNYESGEYDILSEKPTKSSLEKFFSRLLSSFRNNAQSEIDRVRKRLPTMKALKFPYPAVRAGQKEFMSCCYSAVKRGKVITACAPTGTGKTVSVLYPAVRAMGEGECSKVFYLTPKGTTALAAAQTLQKMRESGAKINSVIISSKERICQSGTLCRRGLECSKRFFSHEQMTDACAELLSLDLSTIDKKQIQAVAQRYEVCPHELSLNYSMMCDVIICDYNYLFDSKAYLRRYFDRGGDYFFLIDEAHNLPDRIREGYSSKITLTELKQARKLFEGHEGLFNILNDACHKFAELLYPLCKQDMKISLSGERVGGVCESELPSGLHQFFASLKQKCERAYFARRADFSREEYNYLREFLDKMRTFVDICAIYDRKFNTIIQIVEHEITLKLLCIDPSSIISNRLSRGKGAVMFSATLQPSEYYNAQLTDTRSSQSVEIPSPFERENLCIAVLDSVSARYNDREANAPVICDAIYATVSSRAGNYMVFCPSFSYMESLSKCFSVRYPKLKTITQKQCMTQRERTEFLAMFKEGADDTLVAFCVMGGIYSEGIDLAGDKLIGAVIIGAGMPTPTPEREAMREYYQQLYEAGHEYAYIYPGMNRVLQAAGRVIRRDEDRGVLLLIDDRLREQVYRKILPEHWHSLKYTGDIRSLSALFERFWKKDK